MEQPLDALIVGAGFAGLNTLSKLRNQGFAVKIYETGSDIGGVWFWNRYPGARVDTNEPVYQLIDEPAVWANFEWSERFPGREELMRYFHFADKVLGLSRDIELNTCVSEAAFDNTKNLWHVSTAAGRSTWVRHLILCTGFASKRYTPSFKGLDTFKGSWYHSGFWPEEGVHTKGKRVAVIGTGTSGVQVIQEIGPLVSHLTVYQRTPNLALPMRQVQLDGEPNSAVWRFPDRDKYQEIFADCLIHFGGAQEKFVAQKFDDASPAERRAVYEAAWAVGGFEFWVGTYAEIYTDQRANDDAYNFWVEKTRCRLRDAKKRDLLAPLQPPHAFGTRRPTLETSYYEVLDKSNVDLIDVRRSPIVEVTEEGVRTKAEGVIPVDIIVLATGFDSNTGGILNIRITNGDGLTLAEKWSQGTKTFLGMASAGFPNLFWLYGPQAPTAFANGATCGAVQASWMSDLLVKMRRDGTTKAEAVPAFEDEWVAEVKALWTASLFSATRGSYNGANIPGKIVEPLNYFGGIPVYIEKLNGCKEINYKGFTFS